jgi:hypothetical protein
LKGYQRRMIDRVRHRNLIRSASAGALLALGLALSGCAEMGDSMSTAFADPAKYDFFDCKQLEAERKSLATRGAELEGLMAKAQTGFAGPVVAEVAYRNDYLYVRGQSHFAEEAWQRNKCKESPPTAPAKPAAPAKQAAHVAPLARAKPAPPSRSDASVY